MEKLKNAALCVRLSHLLQRKVHGKFIESFRKFSARSSKSSVRVLGIWKDLMYCVIMRFSTFATYLRVLYGFSWITGTQTWHCWKIMASTAMIASCRSDCIIVTDLFVVNGESCVMCASFTFVVTKSLWDAFC